MSTQIIDGGAYVDRVQISTATLSPVTATINSKVTLTVTVIETTVFIEAEKYYSGEFISGEV